MDQDLRAYLEEREARMDARLDERFARMDERFARLEARLDERFERVETEARQTRVLVEAVHDDVRLLADGVIGTGERIDALRAETTSALAQIKGNIDMIHQVLVPRVQALETRVNILQDKAERENRDVLDVIRERFGRRPAQ